MAHISRFAAIAGMAAACSMASTPAAAAEIPQAPAATMNAPIFAPGMFEADEVNVDRHRRYRHYRGYRRGHVRTGDVLAGVLILGGIAAIASAASNNKRERYRDSDYRRDDRRYRNSDYRERRGDSRYNGSRGIDGAVNQCVSEIERDVRVDTVDSVDRNGEGWRVTGAIFNGDRFTCQIGSDGRIENIDYGSGFSSSASYAPAKDNQHSDDRYKAAWNQVDSGAANAPAAAPATSPSSGADDAEARPAYPGGPLPGEEVTEDDRYRTAQADVTN